MRGTEIIRAMLHGTNLEVIADAVNIPVDKLSRFVRNQEALGATVIHDIVAILGSGELCFDPISDTLRPCEMMADGYYD